MDDLVLHCHPLYKENFLLLCCFVLLLNVCWSLLGDVSAAIFVYKGMTKKRLLFDVLCNDCSYFVTAITLLFPPRSFVLALCDTRRFKFCIRV
uniref:Uncharacterized protein n=1 Tax=Ixodes scapularis TaxID=6945 RepID=A0A4D5RH11_IXOSC